MRIENPAPNSCRADRLRTRPWREFRSCLLGAQACLPGIPAASSGCGSLRLPLWTTGGDSEEVGISPRSLHGPGTAAEPVRDTGAARGCDPGGCDWKSRRDRRCDSTQAGAMIEIMDCDKDAPQAEVPLFQHLVA